MNIKKNDTENTLVIINLVLASKDNLSYQKLVQFKVNYLFY